MADYPDRKEPQWPGNRVYSLWFTSRQIALMLVMVETYLVGLATAEQATVEDLSLDNFDHLLEATAEYQAERVMIEAIRRELER